MKHISFVRLIIFSTASIFVAGIMHHLISNNSQFTVFPQNFGKTHFIQGITHYPEIEKKPSTQPPFSVPVIEVFFCPSPHVCEKLCALINSEQKKINIAIYNITDRHIVQALINAKKRGVIVEMVTDRSCSIDRFSKIGKLYSNTISVFLYQPPFINDTQQGLMHNKFALFFENEHNKQIVWHGSFNFTVSGYKRNCESILIIEDKKTFDHFAQEFEKIKKQSTRYKPK